MKTVFQKFKTPVYLILVIVLSLLSVFIYYHFVFWNRIYPNIYISGINVSGKTMEEAFNQISSEATNKIIVLSYNNEDYTIPLNKVNLKYDIQSSIQSAFNTNRPFTRVNNILKSINLISNKTDIPIYYTIDDSLLSAEVNNILLNIQLRNPVYPSVSYSNGAVVVEKGSPGEYIDKEALIANIRNSISSQSGNPIEITVLLDDPSINQEQANILALRAQKLIGKSIDFTSEDTTITLKDSDIIKLISTNGEYNNKEIENTIDNISSQVTSRPQNPVFIFENEKVKEFKPAKEGLALDTESFKSILITALDTIENSDSQSLTNKLPLIATPPDYQTSDINNLGIKELIGKGSSRYTGSIPSRVHNIALASSKFTSILVKPDEIFSFNQTLGEVSNETGYQQAYVIRNGRTELGDGGGVCQVSTTLFRAALDAGLPIVERRPHSYRVSYYEQGSPPGIDATVYEPSPDLKFKNDTPGHLLIQPVVDTNGRTLEFEIYGTSDGRASTISKPVVTGVTPPPEDLYIDDPSLPSGTVKQIDWKAWGAKVSFSYKVERDGKTIIDEVFNSTYKPWQAKFLRGTGPAN